MKLIQSVLILALVASFVGNCACISSGSSVTNSSIYAYQAAVLCPVIMCSGVIVSSKNVLTTATCINNLSPSNVQIRVGSNKYYTGGLIYDVADILKHSSFVSGGSSYDYNIAILTVVSPFDFVTSAISKISLAVALPPTNSFVTASAYGATDSNLNLPNVLQRVNLKVYSQSQCQTYKTNRLTASMFCVGVLNGEKDLCPGDQGAPAVYENTLVGIYNWGCSCGLAAPNPSSPVLTSVVYLRDWIQSNIDTTSYTTTTTTTAAPSTTTTTTTTPTPTTDFCAKLVADSSLNVCRFSSITAMQTFNMKNYCQDYAETSNPLTQCPQLCACVKPPTLSY